MLGSFLHVTAITTLSKTSCHISFLSRTRLNTKRETKYKQGRERELRQENKNGINGSVTGVVHLDCNQGAPKYLYKNVEVCM